MVAARIRSIESSYIANEAIEAFWVLGAESGATAVARACPTRWKAAALRMWGPAARSGFPAPAGSAVLT